MKNVTQTIAYKLSFFFWTKYTHGQTTSFFRSTCLLGYYYNYSFYLDSAPYQIFLSPWKRKWKKQQIEKNSITIIMRVYLWSEWISDKSKIRRYVWVDVRKYFGCLKCLESVIVYITEWKRSFVVNCELLARERILYSTFVLPWFNWYIYIYISQFSFSSSIDCFGIFFSGGMWKKSLYTVLHGKKNNTNKGHS